MKKNYGLFFKYQNEAGETVNVPFYSEKEGYYDWLYISLCNNININNNIFMIYVYRFWYNGYKNICVR